MKRLSSYPFPVGSREEVTFLTKPSAIYENGQLVRVDCVVKSSTTTEKYFASIRTPYWFRNPDEKKLSWWCDCKGHQYRPEKFCRHLTALYFRAIGE